MMEEMFSTFTDNNIEEFRFQCTTVFLLQYIVSAVKLNSHYCTLPPMKPTRVRSQTHSGHCVFVLYPPLSHFAYVSLYTL